MTNYTCNTIFTDYGMNKINNQLLQNYEDFNFAKVKIGNKSGDFESSRTKLTNTVYTLLIESVTVTNNVYNMLCTIPSTVEGFNIKEVGIYDTIKGVDNLFAITVLDTTKPADLPYKLLLTLDINLKTVNLYPIYPEVVVKDYTYASVTKTDDLSSTFNYITTNLERTIDANSTEIGYNKAQVFYNKESELQYNMQNFIATSTYSKLLNTYGNNLIDSFFKVNSNIFYYHVRNLSNFDSYLKVSNEHITSYRDNINFNNSNGVTLFVKANLGSLSDGLILGKMDLIKGYSYFEFKLKNNYLIFTLYSPTGYYSVNYNITEGEVTTLSNSVNNYIITFNSNFASPQVNIYINNKETKLFVDNKSFTGLTYNANLPLTNYTVDEDKNIVINNSYSIQSILFFGKVLNSTEMYLLDKLLV